MIALTWDLQTAAIAFAMVSEPEYAAGIVNAVTALTPMWGIALSVLGINIVKRSWVPGRFFAVTSKKS